MYTDLVFSVLKIIQLDQNHPNEINFNEAIFRSSDGRVLKMDDIKVINYSSENYFGYCQRTNYY